MESWSDAVALAAHIFKRCNGDVRLALPLGLGKPVALVDALVDAAAADASLRLSIFTALTLEPPNPTGDVERRFLEPAMGRLFGDVKVPNYAQKMRAGTLPDNVDVAEFFLLAGRWLGVDRMQQNYISANYTHARDILIRRRPNVLVQLVAEENGRLSLSCNTDITADLLRFRSEGRMDFLAIAQIHPDLPFLTAGAGEVDPNEFAIRLDVADPGDLFGVPRRLVGPEQHAIGLHVSRLIEDGGTLQIGIGAIGDAVGHALLLRHRAQDSAVQDACPFPRIFDATGSFRQGLYGVTELLTEAMLRLYEEDIVIREAQGATIHAGFFVESRDFYRRLREMPPHRRARIAMMPVSYTNALYGDEHAKRAARKNARFINAAMQVSLLGDAMSDSLENGQVVSGIGGQFDFVTQAFALEDGRAILTLPATRQSAGRTLSNIRHDVATVSVPRHLRDIVVTEYGIADLRGLSDNDTIAALLCIADSRFQGTLMARAKATGKLRNDYEIPSAHRRNLPVTLIRWLGPYRSHLPDFPFGTDFNPLETAMLPALERLGDKSRTWWGRAELMRDWLTRRPHPSENAALRRMGWSGDETSMTALAFRGAMRWVNAQDWYGEK